MSVGVVIERLQDSDVMWCGVCVVASCVFEERMRQQYWSSDGVHTSILAKWWEQCINIKFCAKLGKSASVTAGVNLESESGIRCLK
jgi:hypothetical protein